VPPFSHSLNHSSSVMKPMPRVSKMPAWLTMHLNGSFQLPAIQFIM
jgi:hypothetical protein